MSTKYPYGECECIHDACQCSTRGPGPAAYTAVRDGKRMRLCTRCDLFQDRPTKELLVKSMADLPLFEEYDSLGGLCLRWVLEEELKKRGYS